MAKEILEALKSASAKGFWGQVQVDFQDGKPTLVRISETRKLQDMENNRQHETRHTSRQWT